MNTMRISALVLLTVLFTGNVAASTVAQELIQLEGLVTDSTGAVIPGASVTISREGETQRTISGDRGRFSFQISVGRYDLEVYLRGFIRTRLFQVDIPKQPLEPLLIVLPRLNLGRDLMVVDTTERIEAPALDLAFLPDDRPRVGSAIRGKLVIENIGEGAIDLPTRYNPVPGMRNPANLRLGLSLRIPQQFPGSSASREFGFSLAA